MFQKVFIIVCYLTLVYSVNMSVYDVAGNYVITPEDYGYQDNIIFEMWSAGSGSSSFQSNTGIMFCAGNSGSYVKINITTNNLTFNLTLGRGGLSNYFTKDENMNGGASSFVSEIVNEINITLIGAYSSVYMQPYKNTYKYGSYTTILAQHDGLYLDCVPEESTIQYGAPSYAGAFGGKSNQSYQTYQSDDCSGYMGSGSGLSHNCKGGDGALILYF